MIGEKYHDSLILKRNTDSQGNPVSINIVDIKPVMDNHSCIVLSQIPDEYYGLSIEGYSEVFDVENVGAKDYKVDYANGVVYFNPVNIGKSITIDYKGIGCELIYCSRVASKLDAYGNVVETLEEMIEKGKNYLKLIETLGNAVTIINKLELEIKEGQTLYDLLHNDIAIGKPLQEILHSDIVEASKWKDQLHKDVTDGKVLQPLLQQTVDDAEDVKVRLDKSVADAQDDIATIEATGNKEVIIKSSDWVLNDDIYEKEITHPCNSENLHVTAKNADTKKACTVGWQVLDKTRILLKSDEAINMSIILSASYYHATQTISDDIAEEVVKARKGETGLDVKITKIDEQINNVAKNIQNRINAVSHNVNINDIDCTEQLQDFFNNTTGLPIYFPSGKIRFSKPILLPSKVDVLCEKDTEFIFDENVKMTDEYNGSAKLPMFYSKHKILNNISTPVNDYLYWKNGIINGQASMHLDSSKDNYWDSADKDGNTAWGHDYQRGMLILGYNNVLIEDIEINDIFGHAIGHYGNVNFELRNPKIFQGIDDVTHPNGESRRDGVSGGSENIIIKNIKAFTDDDFIAIVNMLDWGFGKCNVKNVLIDGVEYLENNNHKPLQSFAIYGDENYNIDTVKYLNAKGQVSKKFMKLTNINLTNFIINNCNITCVNSATGDNGQIEFNGTIKNLTIDNINYSLPNASYATSFLSNGIRGASLIGHIENLYLNMNYFINDTITIPNTYGKNAFIYNYINSYIININGYVNIEKNAFSDYSFYSGMNGDIDRSSLNTTINVTFNGKNTNSVIKAYSQLQPKLIVNSQSLQLDKLLSLEAGFSYNTNYISGGNFYKIKNGFNKISLNLYYPNGLATSTNVKIATINPLNAPGNKVPLIVRCDKANVDGGSNGWNFNFNGIGYIDTDGSIYVRTGEASVKYLIIDTIF